MEVLNQKYNYSTKLGYVCVITTNVQTVNDLLVTGEIYFMDK